MPLANQRSPHIHYRLRGDDGAPVLIMLRGLGRSMRYWPAELLERLESRFLLLLIDNRGVGGSEVIRRPFTTAAMADDIAHVLDHARIARAHLFGMSLGGMIAAQFALRHGGRLDRLALGCTSPGGRRARRARFFDVLPAARAQLDSRRAACEAEAKLLLGEAYLRANPNLVDRWEQIQREEPTPRVTFALQVLAALRHDISRRLDRITAPTLVVSSDSDALIPPENSRMLARGIRSAELAWLHGAGHDFATECPEETADMLTEFMLR